jgi:hypothetical protein
VHSPRAVSLRVIIAAMLLKIRITWLREDNA